MSPPLLHDAVALSFLYEQEGVRLLRARGDDTVERDSQARLNFVQAYQTLRLVPLATSRPAGDENGVSSEFEVLFRLAATAFLGQTGSKGRQEAIRSRSMKPSSSGDAALRAILMATLPQRERDERELVSGPVVQKPHAVFSRWQAIADTCLDPSTLTDRGAVQIQAHHRRASESLKDHAERDALSHLSDLVLVVSLDLLEARRTSGVGRHAVSSISARPNS